MDDELPSCSCPEDTERPEPHPCPFNEEMNGDSETLCTCCSSCEEGCAMDI